MRIVFFQDLIDFCCGKGHPSFERIKWSKRHKENNTIIVIGDSHTYFFSGHEFIRPRKIAYHHGVINSSENLLPAFSPIHIGPVLAYNANKYGTKTQGREKMDYLIKKQVIEQGARVMFSYGTIDIRSHVVRQAREHGISIEGMVDKVLTNYLSFLVAMREEGFRVACWGPTPSCPDAEKPSDEFPVCGDEITRNNATLYFNERLKSLCQQNNLSFVSIAEKLIDERGRIRRDYFVDEIHLSQKAWSLVAQEQFRFGL